MILVIVLYALFALTFSAGKKAMMFGSPLGLAWSRTFLTVILLLPFYFIKYKTPPKFNLNQFLTLLAYSCVAVTSFIGANWALLRVSSIKVALFYALTPLITAAISYLFYNESLNKYKILGMIVGLIGILSITISGAESSNVEIHMPGLPELFLAIAVTAYSAGWFIINPLITKHKYSPIYINGIASFISALICTALMVITQTSFPVSPEFWQWAGIQTLFSSIICYSLYMYLLHFYSTNFLAFACFLEPIFAAIYGWILLSETPSITFWIATIIISIGLCLFYKGELTSKEHHDNLFKTYND